MWRARKGILFAVLCGGYMLPVLADSYPRVNVNLATRYLVPGYQNLASATHRQVAAFERFCTAPTERHLKAARRSFHAALDSWMYIQHIDFGPIERAFRRQRVNHWPEQRNAVAKALKKLLSDQDPAVLSAESFSQLSVAVQGFPAAERLLFDATAPAGFERDSKAGRYRCQWLIAIAENLHGIAEQLSRAWQEKVLPALATGGSIYFPKPAHATRRTLTSMRDLLQTVADLKLERVLGESLQKAKPRLTENRRSGRARRNILLNLESARIMYGATDNDVGFNQFVQQTANGSALNRQMLRAFDDAIEAVRTIPEPLENAIVEPLQRERVVEALEKVELLRDRFRDIVPKAAGITLGFTSFGD